MRLPDQRWKAERILGVLCVAIALVWSSATKAETQSLSPARLVWRILDRALPRTFNPLGTKNSENSKANRIETMKGPAEIWTNLFGGSKKNSEENSEK